nr:transcription factor, MADS-box [Tanacetum cinerariifolium]
MVEGSPEISPQYPCILKDMINVYKRNRANGKIRSYGLLEFCKDGKDKIEGELVMTKNDNLEGKNPTRFGFMDKHSVGELKGLSFCLGLKIIQVKSRIEFLKSKPVLITTATTVLDLIMVWSFGSSNAIADHGYKPVMLMGQNLLGYESNSIASAMSKDDDNSLYDGAIELEVVQQLEQPQIMDSLSCFRP